jgi:hypothetical protein
MQRGGLTWARIGHDQAPAVTAKSPGVAHRSVALGFGILEPQPSRGGQGDLPAAVAGEELRASHADRDQVVELLRVAAGTAGSRKNWTTAWNAR